MLIAVVVMMIGGMLVIVSVSFVYGCKRNVEPTFDPRAPSWKNLPLRVFPVGGARGASLDAALSFWEREVSCAPNVFLLADTADVADVTLEHDAPPANTQCGRMCDGQIHLACTCYDPVRKIARVYYPAPSTIDVDWLVWAHELGHVIGLAHDLGQRVTVMRVDISSAIQDHAPVIVTDKDSRAICSRYL